MAGKNDRVFIAIVTLLFGYWVSSSAEAQQSETPAATGVSQEKLSQNFRAQHEIGRRFQIDPADLPAPKTGPIVTNRALIVPYAGQAPQVPAGFTATPFATGLVNPRRLLVLPNGDVLVAEQSAGYLTLLRDDGSGHAVWIDRHVEDLNRPYGLAWQGDHVLVADQDGIWSVPHILGALRAGPQRNQRVDQVPPEERKPIAGRIWRQDGHAKGRIRHRAGPSEPSAGRRSQIRRALCRCRLLGQCRRRARTEGDDPAFRCGRLASDDLRVRHAQSDRARIPAADRRALRAGAGARRPRRSTCPPTI